MVPHKHGGEISVLEGKYTWGNQVSLILYLCLLEKVDSKPVI